MRPILLILAAALVFTGCASTSAAPAQDYGDGALDPMDATPVTYETEPSTLETIGDAMLSVPETAIVWPYKIVSGGLRGIYDGVAGGVEDAPMPVVGVAAAPVTGAVGLLKGVGKGVAMEPYYVGDSNQFVQALAKPWK
ncbi:MAG: hypothetical protein ACYTG4_01435 [Planctomycetota bacterium]|jgi:hypothetical protein